MSTWGWWYFSDRVFDAVVTKVVSGWQVLVRLPEVGNMPCSVWNTAVNHYIDGTSGHSLKVGDRIPVTVSLDWNESEGGFRLKASQVDAQVRLLADHVRSGSPVVVEAKVYDKSMSGALGLVVLTGPYRGLRGVVHRANMPGDTPEQQRVFAASTPAGAVLRCLAWQVDGSQTFAQWQAKLSLRNVPEGDTQERQLAPAATKRMRHGWDLAPGKVVDAVVERPLGSDAVLVRFHNGRHGTMVAVLKTAGVLGKGDEARRQRMQNLKPGTKVAATVKLHKRGDNVELVATETTMAMLSDIDQTRASVVVNARVTRVFKKSIWVDITSSKYVGLAGIVRLARQKSQECVLERAMKDALVPGDVISARVVHVNWSAHARMPLVLSLKVATEETAHVTWSVAA